MKNTLEFLKLAGIGFASIIAPVTIFILLGMYAPVIFMYTIVSLICLIVCYIMGIIITLK